MTRNAGLKLALEPLGCGRVRPYVEAGSEREVLDRCLLCACSIHVLGASRPAQRRDNMTASFVNLQMHPSRLVLVDGRFLVGIFRQRPR